MFHMFNLSDKLINESLYNFYIIYIYVKMSYLFYIIDLFSHHPPPPLLRSAGVFYTPGPGHKSRELAVSPSRQRQGHQV